MAFIDGENLVMRYQDMVAAGAVPRVTVAHLQDVFVWEPRSIQIQGLYEIERATYYTYFIGDEPGRVDAAAAIKMLTFEPHLASQLPRALAPRVFKKVKGARGKGVDIQLCVDALVHAARGNFEIFYLIGGDGDYRPLIEEMTRAGKQVYVAALSKGISPLLKEVTDVFVDLDHLYFSSV